MTSLELKERIGTALRHRRAQLGMRLQDVSDKSGISLGFISQVELGANSPSLHVLYRIAAALDLSLVTLFASIDPKNKQQEKT